MPDTFQTFQKFNDSELAVIVAEQLRTQGIESEIVNEAPTFDTTFANNNFDSTIELKLSPSDFIRAHAALEGYYRTQLDDLDPDYYLFSFTDDELLELVQSPDEWGHLDYALAKQILAQRGRPVTPEQVSVFQNERLHSLAQPEKLHPYRIFLGYAGAISGGVFGFILGYILAYMKKTLPNGDRVFMYRPEERRHGKHILVLSAIFFPYWLWVLLSGGNTLIPWMMPF